MNNFNIAITQKICSSIDEFAVNVQGHHIHPVKIQPGAFNSYFSLIDASNFTLMIRQVEYQYYEAGKFKEGTHGCAFLSDNGSIIYNNRKYVSGEKMVTDDEDLDAILSTNLRMVTCFIDDTTLNRYFTEEETALFHNSKTQLTTSNRRVKCDNSFAIYLNDLILNLARQSLVITNHVIYEDLCEEIYLKMFNFFTDTNETDCINIKPKHRLETLKKAMIFIHDNDSRSLHVTDISQHVYTSQRNLQKLFLQYLGTSPKNYLISRRLHKIRNELLQADPSSTHIHVVSEKHGVIHQGNFARDYYKFFGEYPKDTLKKHKKTHILFK